MKNQSLSVSPLEEIGIKIFQIPGVELISHDEGDRALVERLSLTRMTAAEIVSAIALHFKGREAAAQNLLGEIFQFADPIVDEVDLLVLRQSLSDCLSGEL